MNKVQIIADSTNEFGQRITSAILTFPRYLLAEVNTHRMLSRNSASSRAIRFEKMVKSVQENPFIPFKWQMDHTGMQGNQYISEVHALAARDSWLEARDQAIEYASYLNEQLGVTKQLCNRLLEPFMYHTALVTGTDLENFFALRAQEAAEIHFQDLAYKFLDSMNESEPKRLKAGEWHIPFGDQMDEDKLYEWIHINIPSGSYSHPEDYVQREQELKVKIATVRCARISYHTPDVEQKIDYEADLKLHDRLAPSGHWSAFEHCARSMSLEEMKQWRVITGTSDGKAQWGWCGNFRGFIQYRKMFPNENRSDNRLIKK